MQISVPEYIRSLVPYVPGKPIEETQREFGLKRVVKLASNENPLGPSPKAIAAARKALSDIHRYPDASGFRLKKALSENLKVQPSGIVLGNGSNEIIELVIRTFCSVDDWIITPKASFIAYQISAQTHGVKTLHTETHSGWKPDLQSILKAVRENEKVKIVFLANPNNPTGSYIRDQDLREFLTQLNRIRGGRVLVVLDYAYWEYVTARDLSEPIGLTREFPQVILLRTFSKVYGLAGLRIGYAVASPEIIDSLDRVRMPFNLGLISLASAEAALSDRAFVSQSLKTNALGMKFWTEKLEILGVPFWPSQGNFLLADVQKGLGKSGLEVYQACLGRGVIFRPVANYGLPQALRVTIGTELENQFGFQALLPELPEERKSLLLKTHLKKPSKNIRARTSGKK